VWQRIARMPEAEFEEWIANDTPQLASEQVTDPIEKLPPHLD
jgi:hypothetical protein